MNINFSDIARMANQLADQDLIAVKDDNTLVATPGTLGDHKVVTANVPGARLLSADELFTALAKCAGEEFATSLREGLQTDAHAPLSARDIRIIAAKSAAAIETQSHIRQLESGLKAKESCALDPQAIIATVAGIHQSRVLVDLLSRSSNIQTNISAVYKAAVDLSEAREQLAHIDYANLDRAQLAERLDAMVDAQSELECQLTDFANQLRFQMSAAQLQDEAISTQLQQLDDSAILSSRHTAQLDGLAQTIHILAQTDPLPTNFAQQLNQLLAPHVAISPADLNAATTSIQEFNQTAQHLFAALAHLDNAQQEATIADDAHPAATALQLLSAVETAHAETKAKFQLLENQPGIDQKALAQFKQHLEKLEKRVATCRNGVRDRYVMDSIRNFDKMFADAIDVGNERLLRVAHGPFFVKQLQDFRKLLADALTACNHNPQRIVAALKDPNSQLRKLLAAGARMIYKHGDQSVTRLLPSINGTVSFARMVALHTYEDRLQRLLSQVDDQTLTSPFSGNNTQLLGEVLRGELDLANYLELQEAGLPAEMLRPDLIPVATKAPAAAASGAINSVEFVPMVKTGSGAVNTFVIKNHESGEQKSATHSTAARFSSHSHARNTAKLNRAAKLAADLIGCGNQITDCCIVRYKNRLMLAQETAKGCCVDDVQMKTDKDKAVRVFNAKDGSTRELKLKNGLTTLSPANQARARIALQREFAKLEWADWLSGQLDRTVANEIFNISVNIDKQGHSHISAEVKGIDNDASWPERRPQLNIFNPIGSSHSFDAGNGQQGMFLATRAGLRSSRVPTFLPMSVKAKIEKLTIDDFRAQMAPYLSAAALDSAVSRLQEMKDRIASGEFDGRLIDDLRDVNQLTDDEAVQDFTNMDTIAKNYYKTCRSTYGAEGARAIFGGFYSALFHS